VASGHLCKRPFENTLLNCKSRPSVLAGVALRQATKLFVDARNHQLCGSVCPRSTRQSQEIPVASAVVGAAYMLARFIPRQGGCDSHSGLKTEHHAVTFRRHCRIIWVWKLASISPRIPQTFRSAASPWPLERSSWRALSAKSRDTRKDYGEVRHRAFAEIEGKWFQCVYTLRGDVRHIITVHRINEKRVRRWLSR
jgi:hypothetical protein